jgi:hypothetical protein
LWQRAKQAPVISSGMNWAMFSRISPGIRGIVLSSDVCGALGVETDERDISLFLPMCEKLGIVRASKGLLDSFISFKGPKSKVYNQ